ncbi:DMT family transporter [Rhodospirillum rubrum]|uniref:Small multidrug resistance protein n=1 Tax=Rhodospirillum rubrum (strain ATCC 11170 / ATH 1.1.1 / DSM 467 / LMG 4362 / NCIMB 8255 / S1) TaxID=269796 RepID=Q2RNZ8_RHORT|nr:multidrug efflux SMR transporter [Rhodospirillum rubrum]ABC24147.1 Small multidrug resistance protein [Rhodospirillum rubrum ATCC 11170]AEO49898.1 small multidrug resistance protein [Rhodospirillum rubrum F11]MBK5955861.1 multidrug SMR transporter [Rhodospirillum rubrum]QXG80089.1 multidrug efflux SMR transporter [Rhodospirillum rubrum]HAP98838.1 QacE family quaternary ammonium compound efflux SMR transporter [Rhodospirillum rubrum]
MTWLTLTGAILFELAGTTAMKLSEGFTRLLPSVALVVCYAISFTLLTLTLKKMDVSIAYAIWSGAGTVLITVIGILVFKEPATLLKVLCIALIVAGVVGLNLLSKQ